MNNLPHHAKAPSSEMAEYIADRYRLRSRQLERRARHPNRRLDFRRLLEFLTTPNPGF